MSSKSKIVIFIASIVAVTATVLAIIKKINGNNEEETE